MNDDQFWAVLTSKRDEGLAHLTAIIEQSGVDEFCEFLIHNVMPVIADNGESEIHGNTTQLLISHMAMVGAVDAMMAFRDSQSV
jgi:hypothetical protein